MRELWAQRFSRAGAPHPYSLYTHIPFCPKICTFCQCKTGLLTHDDQVDEYLSWLEGEMSFFGEIARLGRARMEYIGGGTPNILNESQLDRLLHAIRTNFRHEEGARRTFEFLPSALRPGQLEHIRGYGYNRLSCGVQSANETTLVRIRRTPQSMTSLGDTLDQAYGLGFDEINLDLIWGLAGEGHDEFVRNLRATLDLQPTSVTVHKLIHRKNSPLAPTPDQEVEREIAFRRLGEELKPMLEEFGSGYVWIHRFNSAAVVRRTFYESDKFSLWYYSDNERIHLDMLGIGQHAGSRIMGACMYDCVGSPSPPYNPDEKKYAAFKMDPEFDAALDTITDLLADGRSHLRTTIDRYGVPGFPRIEAALANLSTEGTVRGDGESSWEYLRNDGVFVDNLEPLISLVTRPHEKQASALGSAGKRERAVRDARPIRVRGDGWSLDAYIEIAKPDSRYYKRVGDFGVFHSPEIDRERMPSSLIDEVMRAIVVEISAVVNSSPEADLNEMADRVARRFPGDPAPR